MMLGSCLIAPVLSAAQGGQQRKSPHETVTLDVDGKKIAITYGRPSLKGRKAFSGELAPSDQVWRLGADEATKLVLSADAMLNGSLKVPAGSYALFAIPGESKWTVIVNKTADQWGAFNYDQGQDLGRFTVPTKKVATTEQFTIKLAKSDGSSAMASMAWQDTEADFSLKFV